MYNVDRPLQHSNNAPCCGLTSQHQPRSATVSRGYMRNRAHISRWHVMPCLPIRRVRTRQTFPKAHQLPIGSILRTCLGQGGGLPSSRLSGLETPQDVLTSFVREHLPEADLHLFPDNISTLSCGTGEKKSLARPRLTLVACMKILTSSSRRDGDCNNACRSSNPATMYPSTVLLSASVLSCSPEAGEERVRHGGRRGGGAHLSQSSRPEYNHPRHSSQSSSSSGCPPSSTSRPRAASSPRRRSQASRGPGRPAERASPRIVQCPRRICAPPRQSSVRQGEAWEERLGRAGRPRPGVCRAGHHLLGRLHLLPRYAEALAVRQV